jgi:hypothetical protein
MKKIKFNNLRMTAIENDGKYFLEICVASGHTDFTIGINIEEHDFNVIETDEERSSFLHAAFHHPFQLKDTSLNEGEQRHYLDIIIHSTKSEVEKFLTEMDNGSAHGAVSNMVSITSKRDYSLIREGHWFK